MMAGTGVPLRYGLRFVNGDGGVLDFARIELDPLARQGDWVAPPFSYIIEPSADGSFAAPSSIQYERPAFVIPSRLRAEGNTLMRDLLDAIEDIMAGELNDGTPNRGYLELTRNVDIAVPDLWTMPVVPVPWKRDDIAAGTTHTFDTTFTYQGLDKAWTKDPPVSNAAVVSPGGAWSTTTFAVNPGRPSNTAIYPTWAIDGPTSGTIDTITITNNTTGYVIQLTGLALATGQTLTITTGFLLTSAMIGATDVYWKRSQSTVWFPLRPLVNNITITKNASNTSAVRLTYAHRRTGLY